VPAIYINISSEYRFRAWRRCARVTWIGIESQQRILALSALPIVALFLFHIAARTALVALAGGLLFLALTRLCAFSRKGALLTAATIIVAATMSLGSLYQRAVAKIDVNATAPDASLSDDPRAPGSQSPLPFADMEEIWHHIVSEPARLPFGGASACIR